MLDIDPKLLETIKCKSDEFLIVRYSGEFTEEMQEVARSIVTYCQEVGTPCIVIPANDDEFHMELSQMDVKQLRRLSDRIQTEIQKKSKILLE